ncbi:MAG TPA: hypothetical protein VE553_04395 [Candidatus Binatia bacterium]|jgi:hypothetical protein|nr:hypothetical protein [Candidatus Binatia bacterium]
MTNRDHTDYETVEAEEHADALEEGAVPDPVGVYERPERSTLSPSSIAIIVVLLLLVAIVVVFAFIL